MKIGVLSDTHGEMGAVRQAIRILHEQHVGLAIHCGDVGAEVVPLLKGLPTHFVPGNMDDPEQLREAITEPEHTLHQQLGTLEIEGRRLAFLHGHDVKLLRHTIHSGHMTWCVTGTPTTSPAVSRARPWCSIPARWAHQPSVVGDGGFVVAGSDGDSAVKEMTKHE